MIRLALALLAGASMAAAAQAKTLSVAPDRKSVV